MKRNLGAGAMKNKAGIMVLLLVVLTAGLAFSGCGGNVGGDGSGGSGGSADGSGGLSGTVVIAGSTSVLPLSEELAEVFMSENAGVSVEVQGGGSGQGIKAVQEKIADFGSLSREVKEEEQASIQETFVIAKDGIAVVVNPGSSAGNLTTEQLKDIFTGVIANWKEVGGEDAAIMVVAREEGSGTRSAFGELTKVIDKDATGEEKDQTVQSALVAGSTGQVMQMVAATPGAVGYISLGSLNDTVKAVSVNDVTPSVEAVLSGGYALSRPFLYISGAELTPAARAFVDFILSADGQKIVSEAGFIPVGNES